MLCIHLSNCSLKNTTHTCTQLKRHEPFQNLNTGAKILPNLSEDALLNFSLKLTHFTNIPDIIIQNNLLKFMFCSMESPFRHAVNVLVISQLLEIYKDKKFKSLTWSPFYKQISLLLYAIKSAFYKQMKNI